jgi:very-short-patch-repair endonuclease
MSYITYEEDFQKKVIKEKKSGTKVKDICDQFGISIYTLYKILHVNGEMPTPSQASEGTGSEEGVEHRSLSPNNNDSHERPTSTWKNYGNRHKTIEHVCKRCEKRFQARDRGSRTKFCSNECKTKYRAEKNSTIKKCDHCDKKFRIKNSAVNSFIHCKECRGKKLGSQTSKMSRQIGKWLEEEFLRVEKEKVFDWFYNKKKPKGRFKLDYFLPQFNLGIEYDGEHHFYPCFTSRWESVEKIQKRDMLKEKLCAENDIKIIRFRYDEKIDKKNVLMKIYAEL